MSDQKNEKKTGPEKTPIPETISLIVPEVVEALKQEQVGQININILLAQVSQKADSTEKFIEQAEQLIRVAERYEEHRVTAFKSRAEAIIDIKTRDPDEVDKRRSNECRRALKWIISGCAIVGLIGTVVCAVSLGNVLVTGALLIITVIALAMLGPLASGESISSNDVVRIVTAARGLLATSPSETSGDGQGKKKNRR